MTVFFDQFRGAIGDDDFATRLVLAHAATKNCDRLRRTRPSENRWVMRNEGFSWPAFTSSTTSSPRRAGVRETPLNDLIVVHEVFGCDCDGRPVHGQSQEYHHAPRVRRGRARLGRPVQCPPPRSPGRIVAFGNIGEKLVSAGLIARARCASRRPMTTTRRGIESTNQDGPPRARLFRHRRWRRSVLRAAESWSTLATPPTSARRRRRRRFDHGGIESVHQARRHGHEFGDAPWPREPDLVVGLRNDWSCREGTPRRHRRE